MKPRIGLLAGDPSGIGPEVTGKLLAEADTWARAEIVPIGDAPPDCPSAQANAIAGAYTIELLRAGAAARWRGCTPRAADIQNLVYC